VTCAAAPPLPVDVGRLLSRYGMRLGRVSRQPTYHAGLDLASPPGTPVYAIAQGIVQLVTRDQPLTAGFRGYGNAVVLYHPELQRWSFYAHLRRTTVTAGQLVTPGTQVGEVGSTSNGKFRGMPPHLHLEVRRATRDGRSPFPGAYRVYNEDPELLLATLGIEFSRTARIELTGNACPPGAVVAFRGLGGIGQVPAGDLSDEYEPPYPDPDLWIFQPKPALVIGGVVGVVALGALIAGGIALLDRRSKRK